LEGPRKELAQKTLAVEEKNRALAQARAQLAAETATFDELWKKRTKMEADVEGMRKKLATLEPQSFKARLSEKLRNAPLGDFLNPSEKPVQVVLPDVLTEMPPLKVATVDRCMTCHVNIQNK